MNNFAPPQDFIDFWPRGSGDLRGEHSLRVIYEPSVDQSRGKNSIPLSIRVAVIGRKIICESCATHQVWLSIFFMDDTWGFQMEIPNVLEGIHNDNICHGNV